MLKINCCFIVKRNLFWLSTAFKKYFCDANCGRKAAYSCRSLTFNNIIIHLFHHYSKKKFPISFPTGKEFCGYWSPLTQLKLTQLLESSGGIWFCLLDKTNSSSNPT